MESNLNINLSSSINQDINLTSILCADVSALKEIPPKTINLSSLVSTRIDLISTLEPEEAV